MDYVAYKRPKERNARAMTPRPEAARQRRALQAYELGYFDGLCEAHAERLPSLRSCGRRPMDQGHLYSHPAYPEGFTAGLKDGAEVLLALATIPPPWNV
jgi:hypothetical protein